MHYLSTVALEDIRPGLTLPHEDIIFAENVLNTHHK